MKGVQIIRDVVYGGTDQHLMLDMVQPPYISSMPRAAIIEIHGGGWTKGEKNPEHVLSLAQEGFFCVSINYRLAPAHPFPACLHDCKAAVRYLRAHAVELHIDPERIGVWGGSAGGHLAALLGTSAGVMELEGLQGWPDYSSSVQAVVGVCGASDLSQITAAYGRFDRAHEPALLFGGLVDENPELVQLANPIRFIGSQTPPFLLFHGDADEISPYGQSVLLTQALERAGVQVTLHTAKDGKHEFTPDWQARIDRLRADFFKQVLT